MKRDEYLSKVKPMIDGIKSSAAKYYEVTNRPLGVTGEIAEFEAIEKLNLHPVPPRQDGHDAIRKLDGKEFFIQIKGRVVQPGANKSQRVGTLKPQNKNWSSVVLVLLNEKFQVFEMWEAQRKDILKYMNGNPSIAISERGQISVSKFKALGKKIWSDV